MLVLLPTSENKLLMHWKGPFEVLQRKDGPDYLIDMKGKQKIFHANLLKWYLSAAPSEPSPDDSSHESPSQVTFGTATLKVTSAAILEPEELSEHGPELETLNPLQTETVKDVKISQDLSVEQQSDIQALLNEYRDIFTDVPIITPLEEHRILLTTMDPIRGKAYSLPMPCEKPWDKEIDNMLSKGVIEPSSSTYASPVVMVKKPDGSTRVCIDYRKLNSVTVFYPEPMPTAEEIFAKLAGDRYFSKFDLRKGYWQVPVNEEDRDLTTFVCHRGLFRFRVMPFGLVNAPATFSRLMR